MVPRDDHAKPRIAANLRQRGKAIFERTKESASVKIEHLMYNGGYRRTLYRRAAKIALGIAIVLVAIRCVSSALEVVRLETRKNIANEAAEHRRSVAPPNRSEELPPSASKKRHLVDVEEMRPTTFAAYTQYDRVRMMKSEPYSRAYFEPCQVLDQSSIGEGLFYEKHDAMMGEVSRAGENRGSKLALKVLPPKPYVLARIFEGLDAQLARDPRYKIVSPKQFHLVHISGEHKAATSAEGETEEEVHAESMPNACIAVMEVHDEKDCGKATGCVGDVRTLRMINPIIVDRGESSETGALLVVSSLEFPSLAPVGVQARGALSLRYTDWDEGTEVTRYFYGQDALRVSIQMDLLTLGSTLHDNQRDGDATSKQTLGKLFV